MPYTSVIRYSSTSSVANTTVFFPVATTGFGNAPTTEVQAQVPWQEAGTFSNLRVFVTSSSSTSAVSVVLRVNGVNTSLSASITAGATGQFVNLTTTASINVGDLLSVALNRGGTENIAVAGYTLDFTATRGVLINKYALAGAITGFGNANSPRYFGLAQSYGGGITSAQFVIESGSQTPFRQVGVLRNLSVYVSANTRSTTSSARIRKNTADGNQVVSFTSASFGLFQDVSNTDTAAPDDLFNYFLTNAGGAGNLDTRFLSVDFESTSRFGAANNSTTCVLVGQMEGPIGGANSYRSNTTSFTPILGAPHARFTVSESVLTYMPSKGRITETRVWFGNNTSNTDTNLMVLRNGADTSASLTSLSGSSATLTNTASVEFAQGDHLCMRVVRPVASGNFIIRRIALTVEFDEFTPQTSIM